jgi:hypothetical protein
LHIPFSGVQPFSGNALMPTCGILEFGKKMVVKRVMTKMRFPDFQRIFFYRQNTLIVVPPAFLHNTNIWQHISHDDNKGIHQNGQQY